MQISSTNDFEFIPNRSRSYCGQVSFARKHQVYKYGLKNIIIVSLIFRQEISNYIRLYFVSLSVEERIFSHVFKKAPTAPPPPSYESVLLTWVNQTSRNIEFTFFFIYLEM